LEGSESKCLKVGVGSRKFCKGRSCSWSRIFYLWFRNPPSRAGPSRRRGLLRSGVITSSLSVNRVMTVLMK